MQSMPLWGWVLVALAGVAGLAWRWLTARTLALALQEREDQLQAERDRARELLRDAARLPDLQQRVAEAEAALLRQGQDLTAVTARESAASASLQAALATIATLTEERNAARAERDAARRDHAEVAANLATAAAEHKAAVEAHEQTRQFLTEAQARLRTAFVEAASKVFDDKAAALEKKIGDSAVSSRTGLEATLKPFAEKLGEFQVELRKLGGDQASNLNTLVGSITQLQTLNQTMATSTDNLSRALKGNAKTRGDWGEMILDTVLKASGLEEGSNFVKQESGRDDESGKLLRPDVIVNLPDGRQVVVDSKVNLVAWAEANNADTPEAYQEALLRHTAALRLHVRDLAEKNYPKALGNNALDLTVMFVPIEGALAAALSYAPELQAEAFQKKIVFASPNTLMAMLRVVERLWSRDKLQRQVGVIGAEAGKLLDALSNFVGEFNEIENRIEAASKAFSTAKRRLTESDQSVTARAKRLVEAGAKGKRALAPELIPVIGPPAPESGTDVPEELD